MLGARFFIDSNVLLYARDQELTAKCAAATDWLAQLTSADVARANVQVLNEVTNVLLRKRRDLAAEEIFEQVDALSYLGSTTISVTTVVIARAIRLRTSYSWWDCLLLASAIELGCTHFLSEDLQDGQRIEIGSQALTIVDPFAHTPDQVVSG